MKHWMKTNMMRVACFAGAMALIGVGGHSAFADGDCEPHWDNTIGQPGMDSSVRALAVFDDGSGGGPALYAGGFFTEAGGQPASRIARWDGTEWSPLGAGLSGGWVLALTVFDDKSGIPGGSGGSGGGPAVYAGGYFTSAGGQPANRVARWDGSQWSPLGEGVGPILALASYDGDDGPPGFGPALYAGGVFQTLANRVAKWDGSQWSALGTGMDDTVYALVVFDDGTGPALYAGGSFTTAGGKPANRVAKWDGSEWWPLGAGLDFGSVRALAVFDDGSGSGPALYASGWFTFTDFPNGHEVSRIAKWDAAEGQWLPLGPQFAEGLNNYVAAITVYDEGAGPALYVGGSFTAAGGQPASRIAKWDGSEWSALGAGVSGGPVYALAMYDADVRSFEHTSAVHVGGAFHTAGSDAASDIAVWRECASSPCALGDLNCDGVVDVSDLLILLGAWGPCANPANCPADLNGDGAVDVSDLLILLANWG